MSLSKSETEAIILSTVKQEDNEISRIGVRHLDSVHPFDCKCLICEKMNLEHRFNSNKEKEVREELGYYNED